MYDVTTTADPTKIEPPERLESSLEYDTHWRWRVVGFSHVQAKTHAKLNDVVDVYTVLWEWVYDG